MNCEMKSHKPNPLRQWVRLVGLCKMWPSCFSARCMPLPPGVQSIYVSIRHWICYKVRCNCVYNLYTHSTVTWLHKALIMSALPAGNGEQCAMTEQLDHVWVTFKKYNRPWHWSQSVCRWKFSQWRCSSCTRWAPCSVTARLLKWLCVCVCV